MTVCVVCLLLAGPADGDPASKIDKEELVRFFEDAAPATEPAPEEGKLVILRVRAERTRVPEAEAPYSRTKLVEAFFVLFFLLFVAIYRRRHYRRMQEMPMGTFS